MKTNDETGIAVVIVLLTLFLGTAVTSYISFGRDTYLSGMSGTVGGLDGSRSLRNSSNLKFRIQKLQQAKAALLAYSVSYADNYPFSGAGPGHFPCPDRSPVGDQNPANDGPNPPCSSPLSNMGRFPRFTFSRDQSNPGFANKLIEFYPEQSLKDQQMWYFISPTHINNPINTIVNPSVKGQLSVDGIDEVVAVIVEPGAELTASATHRPSNAVSAYLEGENANQDNAFSQVTDAKHNDLLVFITSKELYKNVMPRVLYFVKQWLQEYKHENCTITVGECYPAAGNAMGLCQQGQESGYVPLFSNNCHAGLIRNNKLDNIDATKHWFVRNEWFSFIRYRRDPECKQDWESKCIVHIHGIYDASQGIGQGPHIAVIPSEKVS